MIRPALSSPARFAAPPAAMGLLLALLASPGCQSERTPATAPEVTRGTPTGESRPPASEPALEVTNETPVDEAPGQDPQVEPHLVVDPQNPSHLVVAWMSVSAGPWEVRLARSTDGGRTWRRRPSPAAAETWRAFDPWLAWAPDGSALYLALVEVRPGSDGGQEWRLPVFRSHDGGESWTRWAEVPGQTLDRPVLLAGGSAVFVLASEAVGAAPIVVASSAADEGEFRVRGRYRPPDGLQILSGAVLTGDSELVFSFTDRTSLQDGRAKPLFAVPFDDQTKRFGEPRRLGSTLFIGAPQLAFDDSPDSPHRGRLYSAWGDRTGGGVASLKVALSDDSGGTWSEPVTIAAGRPATSFITMPAATVDPRGRLGVAWREHVGDLATGCSTVHFAVSLDGGASFPLRREVTPEPSCPDRPANRLDLGGIPLLDRWPGGGDYAGLAVGGDGVFHPLWADSRAGAWRIRAARIELTPDASENGARTGRARGRSASGAPRDRPL